MTATCTYDLPHLSTETMPWVDSFCYTDDAVPAGCPLHFVSATRDCLGDLHGMTISAVIDDDDFHWN